MVIAYRANLKAETTIQKATIKILAQYRNVSNSYTCFFFLKDTAPTEISPFPLHAALPIGMPASSSASSEGKPAARRRRKTRAAASRAPPTPSNKIQGSSRRTAATRSEKPASNRSGEIGRAHV